MKNWDRFFCQFQKDVKLWLFCFFSFGVYRGGFIFYFRNKIDNVTSVTDFQQVFVNGIRYDSMAATAWVILPFLMSVGNGFFDLERRTDGFRRSWGEIFSVVFAGACVVTVNYFKEFNDQFNHFMANLLFDDPTAIIRIIWSDYHVVENFFIISVLTVVLVVIVRRMVSKGFLSPEILQKYPLNIATRTLISLIIVVFFCAGIRGSLNRHPPQRNDTIVTDDDFLNKAVMNPFLAFYLTVRDYIHQNDVASGLDEFLPDHDVRRAAQAVFLNSATSDNLDDYFEKIAPGAKNPPARHIFFVVMESFDSWPLLEKYELLHLADNLTRIAREGLIVKNFIPSTDSTGHSLSVIITGLPVSTVNISASIRTFPTSIAKAFKRLGYKTNLFYGGNDSWLNLSKFGRAQGFDEVYGANHMRSKDTSTAWHIPDEYLFDFVLTKVDDSHPSFNVIMTTSYHPPYIVNVYEKGFPLKSIPEKFDPNHDNPINLNELGHLWYSDKCLGSFVQKAEQHLTRALFAITGDHFSRRFINSHPDFYERSSVPFVLYGKDVLKEVQLPKDIAGSHIDIGPTLVELSAPKGFRYYSTGTNLLTADQNHVGIGSYKIMGTDFMIDLSSSAKIHPLRDYPLPKQFPDIDQMRTLFNRMSAISWWRVVNGSQLK